MEIVKDSSKNTQQRRQSMEIVEDFCVEIIKNRIFSFSIFSIFCLFFFFFFSVVRVDGKTQKKSTRCSWCQNDDSFCENSMFGSRWTGPLEGNSRFHFFISLFFHFCFFSDNVSSFSFSLNFFQKSLCWH